MSRIFVSGVAGFLGSHIAEAMIELGHHVIGVDNMVGGDKDNILPDVEFYQVDCNQVDVMTGLMHDVDVVYHCAALAYEGLSVFSPHIVVESIVGASTGVFSAACANRVKRIVHCSSMARYGRGAPPFMEHEHPDPVDPYGIAKVAAENILRNLCHVHGIEYVIAVPHNIIGPRQKYDDPFRNVASIMMNRMLQGKQPVIYGDGEQQRCFSFVGDCLQCLVKMGFQGGLDGEIINIGPDEDPVSIRALARKIADHTLFREKVGGLYPIFMAGRPQEVRVALCSSTKARRVLGYVTKTSLDDGLKEMVRAMLSRGPRPFKYHLPIEIKSPLTPLTWTDRIF